MDIIIWLIIIVILGISVKKFKPTWWEKLISFISKN